MSYPLWNIFLTVLWIFLWILWLMLLFQIITDIFRSRDLGGWGKAGWLVLVCVLPFLGVLVYCVGRGGDMHERQERYGLPRERRRQSYDHDAAPPSTEQLSLLADLRDRGVIDEAEFRAEKQKALR